MRPLLEFFRAVRRLQSLWRSARDTTTRSDVEGAVREALAQLDGHSRDVGAQVASVLSRVHAPQVSERVEGVRAEWSELARELRDRLDQISTIEHGWRFLWDEINDLLARRVRGAGVRTISDPFGTLLAPAASAAPVFHSSDSRRVRAAAAPSTQPDAGDLRPLIGEQPSVAVLSVVKELDGNAERLFRFVAQEIALSLHSGWFRSPAEVLADRAGNDAEMAGLLIDLLRAGGVPARVAKGQVRESLLHLGERLDVRDPSVLARMIQDSGRNIGIGNSGDDAVVDVFDRFWVQAWLPLDGRSRWVDLDPSERPLEVQPGIGLSSTGVWSPAGETPADGTASLESRYLQERDVRGGPLAYFEEHLRDALTLSGVPTEVPIESLFRRRRALPLPDFPPALQGQRLVSPRAAQAFDDGDTWKISVQIVGVGVGTLFDETRPLPGRNRAVWTLSWQPATEVAAAFLESGRGLGGLPSFAVELRPRFEIRGEDGVVETIEGTAATTAGAEIVVQIVLSAPAPSRTRRSEARIVAGTSWVMRTEPPAADLVDRHVPDRLPVPLSGMHTTDVLAALLEVYHRRLAATARRIAALGDAVSLTGPWISLLGAHLEPLVVARHVAGQRRSSWLLDVKVIDHALYGSSDSASRRGLEELFLAEGSYLEAEWFRALLARPAASTITALRHAVAQGVRLVTVHRGDDAELEALEQPQGVVNALRLALATRHRSITIPVRPVRIGGRDVAAWIARRHDTPPSEYAIAGLWGGILDDDEPEDPEDDTVRVVITRVVDGTLVDIARSEDFTAFAVDGEGRDLTGSIRWDSTPPIGSGAGGQASFTPTAPGGYVIRASVAGQGLQHGGRAEAGSYIATPAIDIEEIRFREPAVRLWHVEEGSGSNLQIVRLDGPIFSKVRRAYPAGLWCRKTIEIELLLNVTFAADKKFRLRVKAEDPDGRIEVQETSRDGVGEGEVTFAVNLSALEKIGVCRELRWSFAIDDGEYESERVLATAVEIFISRAEPIEHRSKVEEHIYRWACTWADDLTGDASEPEVLQQLLSRRASTLEPQLRYGFQAHHPASNNAYELIANRIGMCGAFADWFIALAKIHRIKGKRYRLTHAPPLDRVYSEERWSGWLATAPGLNHEAFNNVQQPNIGVVAKDRYVAQATESVNVHPFEKSGYPFDRKEYWIFSQHFLAVFDHGGTAIYDASFHPNTVTDFIVLPDRLEDGLITVPPGGRLRVYLKEIMPILRGTIRVRYRVDPILDSYWRLEQAFVWHEDIVARENGPSGESIQIRWQNIEAP